MNARRQLARGAMAPLCAGYVLGWSATLAFAQAPGAPDHAPDTQATPVVPAAPQGDPYAIDRYTLDGGGGRSSGGTFEIHGTIGQPDADPLQPSSGGAYEITGGYWPGLAPAVALPDALFANSFE